MSSFGPPRPELDQGDFLLNIPWGLIDDPLTICRPAESPVKGKASFGPVNEVKNPFQSGRHEVIHAKGSLDRAVVLWHGCQIDKWKTKKDPSKAFAAIAPVFILEERVSDENARQRIIAGEHRSYFALPAFEIDDITVPETVVDLRHIWPVRQAMLLTEGQRLASMSDDLRMAMCDHLFAFFTRSQFRESAPCPHCQKDVPLTALLKTVSDD